jgi:hypothetical protein
MLIQNLNRYWRLYAGALLIAVIASAGIYFAADSLGINVQILTRDPYRAAKVPPYYAYVSLLGSTIWLAAGAGTLTVSLFAKRALYARMSDDSTYRIIVIGGATGVMMAVDDILLFHDAIADWVGIPELLFHGFYLLCFLYLIGAARGLLLRTPWILFFASLAFFGVSSVIDEFVSSKGRLNESEDVFKFSAILFWAIYFAQVCWDYIGSKSTVAEPTEH